MSYCRFSSDDFQCDVYVYEHYMGWFVTHVAGNRVVYAEPLPPKVPFDKAHITEWTARNEKVQKMLDAAERKQIGLPHDGETFEDATVGECADRLMHLRELGYNVPQRAIDALREESADVSANEQGQQEAR